MYSPFIMKKWVLFFLIVLLAFGHSVSAQDIQWPTIHNIKNKNAKNVYDRPYSLWENKVDGKLLGRNTGLLVGASVATMGILYLMPSSFTNWEDDDDKSPAKKWWDNVRRGPVWDKDDLFLNYVTHPYAGAIYYMGARSAGANAAYSFLYSFALSTFFWECGIEAFAERPSIQDLIVTPVAGALIGEWFYQSKRAIKNNGGELWGSKAWGKTAMFLMDPMTEVTEWLFDDTPKSQKEYAFSSYPTVSDSGKVGYKLQFQMPF